MTTGFGTFASNVPEPVRRLAFELKREIGLYLPLTGGTLTGQLILPDTAEVSLASTDHALQIGATSAANLAFDSNELQARNNGGAATLELNPHGGTIQLGAGGTPSQQVRIGDDTYFTDINVAHTLGLVSASDSTRGSLKLGSGPTIHGLSTYLHLASPSLFYADANTHYFRNAAGTDKMTRDSNGLYLWEGAYRVKSTNSFYHEDYGGGWYMQDTTWLRSVNNKAIYANAEIRGSNFKHIGSGYVWTHESDTDTGIYYDGDGSYRLIANGQTAAWINGAIVTIGAAYGASLRLYSTSDSNHLLQYSSATPSGSGSASNGPELRGYNSVWLHTVNNDKNLFLLGDSGNCFLSSGGSYTNFSSREFKDNVTSLDPEDCLDHVRRWRPVEFDYNTAPFAHGEGFISEEMVEVTPAVVNITEDDNERPGWANAISYPELTPRLAGAVQALLARVESLEAELAELKGHGRG